MSCGEIQDQLLDAARGRSGAPGGRALRDHVAVCESCRGALAAEERLTTGLRALASAMTSCEASKAVEAALLDRFAELNPAASRVARRRRRGVLEWAAMAAAIAALTSGIAWWEIERNGHLQEASAPARPVPSPATEAPLGSAPAAVHAAVDRPRANRPATKSAKPRPPAARPFVALPGAAGLPDFESGEIVRFDIPVTALPNYGVEIPPDAATPAIQADLLIGQDGRARAIRLVSVTDERR